MKTSKLTIKKQQTHSYDEVFAEKSFSLETLKDGHVRIKVSLLSIEPAMSGWIVNRTNYMPRLELDHTMHAFGVGIIVESKHPSFKVGDRVSGNLGCQTIADLNPKDTILDKSIAKDISDELALSACGLTGLTAYFGLKKIANLKPNDVVVVSAAAGAVGSIVGQLAKIKGCKVIGIVGSTEKMDLIINEFNYDMALNYKDDDFKANLIAATPNGIDVYFDNVGGSILNYCLANINKHARVVLCGAISTYNKNKPMTGPSFYFNLVHKSALMQGFIVLDYESDFAHAREEIHKLVLSGKLSFKTEVFEGLSSISNALQHMFDGYNKGKVLVKINS